MPKGKSQLEDNDPLPSCTKKTFDSIKGPNKMTKNNRPSTHPFRSQLLAEDEPWPTSFGEQSSINSQGASLTKN